MERRDTETKRPLLATPRSEHLMRRQFCMRSVVLLRILHQSRQKPRTSESELDKPSKSLMAGSVCSIVFALLIGFNSFTTGKGDNLWGSMDSDRNINSRSAMTDKGRGGAWLCSARSFDLQTNISKKSRVGRSSVGESTNMICCGAAGRRRIWDLIADHTKRASILNMKV